MPTAGAERRSMLIVTGECSISHQLLNRRRNRRAEKQGLTTGGKMAEDAADVGRNPMSSIRSASSSTRWRRPVSFAYGA
jgi:hypothetical protein